MDVLNAIIAGFVLLIIGVVFVLLSARWFRSDEMENRLQTFVDVQASGSNERNFSVLSIQARELSGSLVNRLFFPVVRRFSGVLGRLTPAGSAEIIAKKLITAGNPARLGPREFYGLRILFLILGIIVGVVVVRTQPSRTGLLLGLAITVLFYFLPNTWLNLKIAARQKLLSRNFPDSLDMLSVCASAGLGFDQSLQRVSEHWETEIGKEFARVIAEMEMGLSRQEALRNFADRVDMPEISSFTSLIIQSDQLGMSVSDTLHSQADQMRIERRYRAQEEARKIPTKMLFPMAFMIFPAIFAVVLGPAVPQLLDFFAGF